MGTSISNTLAPFSPICLCLPLQPHLHTHAPPTLPPLVLAVLLLDCIVFFLSACSPNSRAGLNAERMMPSGEGARNVKKLFPPANLHLCAYDGGIRQRL